MTNRTTHQNGRARQAAATATGRGRPPHANATGRSRGARTAPAPTTPRWRRRTPLLVTGAVLVAVVATVIAVGGGSSAPPSPHAGGFVSGPAGPESVPLEQGRLLATAASAATGQTVDGVQCNTNEQVAYHVHTHLSVYVAGQLRPIPAGIGIVMPVAQNTANGPFDEASRCYYWLHVHAQDGVIHIESPAGHTYTLGQFFDLWGQPLSTDRVGPASGRQTVFVNGRRYRGDPRTIRLGSHKDIQIDVGSPVVPAQRVNWSVTSL